MSSSSSSKPNSEEIQSINVAMEESPEKISRNADMKVGFPQEVISENKINNPCFGFSFARTEGEIMKFYPSNSNKIYTCQFCKKGFSTSQALGGHQNAHKQERKWDKKRKAMEVDFPGLSLFNPYLEKPHLLLGGYSQDALSNENHLGITLDSRKRVVYAGGAIGGIKNMNMTISPCMTPTSLFTGNTSSNGSAAMGLDQVPTHNPSIPQMFLAPPQTTNVSRGLSLQENVLSEKNLISRIGIHNVVKIDDDQPEEEKSRSEDLIDLSLSL